MSSKFVFSQISGLSLSLAAAIYSAPLKAQTSDNSSPSPEVPTNQSGSADLAQQRFREATKAYQDERYSAAASLFEAADRLAPHASNRFNAAAAWEQAGELARAATGYQSALVQGAIDGELGEARRDTAKERLTVLRTKLAQIKIQEPLGALLSVDHIQRFSLPARFYLQPGSYQFDLEFQGQTHHKTEQVFPGKLTLVDFGLVAAPVPSTSVLPPQEPPRTSSGPSAWTWVAFGAGLVLSGVATSYGLDAREAETTAKDRVTTGDNARARDLQRYTNIAWGGAATAGLAGMILLFSTPTVEF